MTPFASENKSYVLVGIHPMAFEANRQQTNCGNAAKKRSHVGVYFDMLPEP